MEININTIFELFDCTRPEAEQQRGLDLSRHEKCLSVFIRPGYPYGEKIWENCAKAIALRTDQELYYNKFFLLEWLQDLSWPGALSIWDRLINYKAKGSVLQGIRLSLREARLLGEKAWEENLLKLAAQIMEEDESPLPSYPHCLDQPPQEQPCQTDLDVIFDLLNWASTEEDFQKGLLLSRSIKCLSVFLQPSIGKSVWDGCAEAVALRDDQELYYYKVPLLEWLQDLTWPGAVCIWHRLQNYKDKEDLRQSLSLCLQKAQRLGMESWNENLSDFMKRAL